MFSNRYDRVLLQNWYLWVELIKWVSEWINGTKQSLAFIYQATISTTFHWGSELECENAISRVSKIENTHCKNNNIKKLKLTDKLTNRHGRPKAGRGELWQQWQVHAETWHNWQCGEPMGLANQKQKACAVGEFSPRFLSFTGESLPCHYRLRQDLPGPEFWRSPDCSVNVFSFCKEARKWHA